MDYKLVPVTTAKEVAQKRTHNFVRKRTRPYHSDLETQIATLQEQLEDERDKSDANNETIETLREQITQLQDALQEIYDAWKYGNWPAELQEFTDIVIGHQSLLRDH